MVLTVASAFASAVAFAFASAVACALAAHLSHEYAFSPSSVSGASRACRHAASPSRAGGSLSA